MEIMGSYSHNSLQTFGVERGSARLTEFDNIYQNHAQTSNLKFRLDVMDTEFLEKMSREALLEDDIEEWSEWTTAREHIQNKVYRFFYKDW